MGARFDKIFNILAITVTATVSFAQRAGQWEISPGLVFVATVDENTHPAFRLILDAVELYKSWNFWFEEIDIFVARGMERLRELVKEGQLSLNIRSSSCDLDIREHAMAIVSLHHRLQVATRKVN